MKALATVDDTKGFSRREMLGLSLGIGSAALIGARSTFASPTRDSAPNAMLEINAKPAPISIAPERTAVVVVDMQNDFGSEDGMFHRAGIDISMIRAAVEPTAAVLDAARRKGITVVYLKMGFAADLSDAGASDSVNLVQHREFMKVGTRVQAPDGSDSRILIKDTWNTEILTSFAPRPKDVVLYKSRFSGFYKTELDTLLKRRGIKYLIFTGCTTSVCVESTVRDAMFRDSLPILLADCMGEPIGHAFSRSNHDASLLTMQVLFGWVSSSKDLIKGLNSTAAASSPTVTPSNPAAQ